MLLKKLKNQVAISLIEFILTTAVVILGICSIVLSLKFTNKGGKPDVHIVTTNTTILLKWISRGLSLIYLPIWIMGILNSIQINRMTSDSTVLVVFSVINLFFAHLWVACYQLKKQKNIDFGIE